MRKISRGSSRLVLMGVLLVLTIGAALSYRWWKRPLPSVVPSPPAQPVATTKPAPPIPHKKPVELSAAEAYLRVVRAAYPGFPATQPLGIPLDISQAAHLTLPEPIYLAGIPRKEIWLTRADAPSTNLVLKEAVDDTRDVDLHVVRERVAFVHWMPTNYGMWPPCLVCARDDGEYEVVSAARGRQPLPRGRGYHWEHAISWNEKVVVPTEHGVSVFRFAPHIIEGYHELATSDPATRPSGEYSEPRILLDWQGLIAWLPWEAGKVGGRGAARYVESPADDSTGSAPQGKWTDLCDESGWPEKILHLVPLLDGTVLMMTVDDRGAVQVQFNTLERAPVKEEEIAKLVDQLSDTDQLVRNAAYDKLSQYGSGIWPILEKMMNDEGPEAQSRMRQLLKQKVTPTLNGMVLLGDKTLRLVARLSDGGTVFFGEAGVSIPNPGDPDAGPDYRVPAWISIRPGRPIELLPQTLTADLTPAQSKLYANGNDWIVTHDVRGPRRFVGNGFVNLLRKSEHPFSEFVGMDRRGRWLFRKPTVMASTTAPSANVSETLIIDPSLPDPTPRLPVWQFRTAETVGWTKADWPVAKSVSAFALHETDWQLLEENEQIYTKAEEAPRPVEPLPIVAPTTQPATSIAQSPTTAPTTTPSTTESSEPPILTDRDGNQYFGGLTDLRVTNKKGKEVTWPLPAIATGKGPVYLIRTSDARLFLFNQPGRVLRIKPTPDETEPYALEKIFTHNIPTIDHPTRIWLDPAGRIIMAWENQLAIMFPVGYIPRAIVEKIPPGDLEEEVE